MFQINYPDMSQLFDFNAITRDITERDLRRYVALSNVIDHFIEQVFEETVVESIAQLERIKLEG